MTDQREDREALIEAEIFKIESTHHFHGDTCLCGFSSARSRSRTEHITTMVRAVFEQAHTPTDDEREARALIAEAKTFITPYFDYAENDLIRRLGVALEASDARLQEAEARAENGPCWDEGFTVPVPRGECAPLPPLCTLKAGHLGAHQAGGATWTRRAAGGIERKLREAEAVIAEELEPKNIGYGHMDVAIERVRAVLTAYKPTRQEENKT